MRILGLRFKNLNSLNGEWSIDFTAQPYASNGIFAVTGPTGAGKTTIFDSICLALYGRTPRLAKISKNSNEIMSRQTGECFSEATFETQDGSFRCHWSQRRARKKPDGKLQDPKHEISDARTGKTLETKIRDVSKAIEDKTGMDFDHFKRSMLLAQGGFDAFLRADPDERGPILEQVTGTEIYSRISIKAHERHREESEKLRLLEAELKGVQVLTKEERKGFKEILKQKRDAEKELAIKNEKIREAENWLSNIDKLEKELESIETELQLFQQKQKEFEPSLKILERADKALALEGRRAALFSLRARQKKDVKELTSAQERIPEHKKKAADSETLLKKAETDLGAVGKAAKQERELIKQVRFIDLQINESAKRKNYSAKDIQKYQTDLKNINALKKQTEVDLDKNKSDIALIENRLTQNKADSALVSDLTGIEEKLKSLGRDFDKNNKLRQALSEAQKEKDSQTLACSELEKSASDLEQRLKKVKEDIKQISESILASLDGREIKDLRDELEELRERSRLLEQASELLAEIAASEKHILDLEKADKNFKSYQESFYEKLKNVAEQGERLETEVEYLQMQATLINRVADLEKQRELLEDGKPCPLCGAEIHPYAKGNIPTIGKTEKCLKDTQKELKKHSSQKSVLEVKLAKVEKDIEQTGQKIQEERSRLGKNKERRLKLFQKLDIKVSSDEIAGKIRVEQVVAQERAVAVATLAADMDKKEKELKSAEQKFATFQKVFNQKDKELQKLKHNQNTAENEIKRLSLEINESDAKLSQNENRALALLQPYGINKISRSNIESVGKNLTRRKDNWLKIQEQKTNLENRLLSLNVELQKHVILIDKNNEDLKKKSALHNDILKELEELFKRRTELFGGKKVDDEEKRLEKRIADSEKGLEKARRFYEKVKQDFNSLSVLVSSLAESVQKRKIELDKEERAFEIDLGYFGFKGEDDYLAARLPQEEREVLKGRAENLAQKQTELKTRQKDRSAKLAAERPKKITVKTRDKLLDELNDVIIKQKNLEREIGAVNQKLSEDAKAREERQERVQVIEAQKKEHSRWDVLRRLIGSADGKKYRNFAQGLTFEIVIAQANQQLRKMTDRYLLLRDKMLPLELNVVDNYQAGEVRSTKNLSGGESFIISLSLALGLSRMAARKASVDSLFLDEGFGALDEESLEIALETLSSLRLDGKLIGVISHVPLLKERISSQIQVLPQSGGQSALNGPGCGRV